MHLVVRASHPSPLWMGIDDGTRIRVGDEAVAERRRGGGIGRIAQPPRDEVRRERTYGTKLGQAAAELL
jgi:hypothetical protein